ncbi:MAG: undecaprenyl-phosphate alpha-N-acetylglucosaminyl 1-phosphate transferase [Deltaproteobacteria bacterium]|nr:undecaprenyl-phosphate alpha-N-acetylglucosaminyl 1-phosphate transferase [Deltaproteobacteria bacterium]
MSWLPILSAAVAAAIASAIGAPMVSRLALVLGVVDRPSERKVNKRPDIPLMGGVAVALGLLVGLAVALLMVAEDSVSAPRIEGLLVGSLMVLALGMADDRFGVGAWGKLLVQVAAAAVAIQAGYSIDHFTDPISRTVYTLPPWLTWLVTTGWIVIVTNSVNLIDGLDGLCTGVSAIIASTLVVIAWQGGFAPGVLLGAALVGALLGFLPYNFPPARMFLGDTGALFIGYVLAIMALEGYGKITLITFLVPLLALAVPLLDTLLSIVRRLRRRTHIMQADKMHLHHRLLREYDGSQRQAVLSIYFLTGCFCLIAVSFTRLEGYAVIVFLVMVGLLTLRIVRNLGILDSPETEEQVRSAKGGTS